MNVDLDPNLEAKVYAWKAEQQAKGVKASAVSFRVVFDQALRLWFEQQGVAIPSPGDDVRQSWTEQELHYAQILVDWMRDAEPRQRVDREVILLALRSYRERKQFQTEAGFHAPSESAVSDKQGVEGETHPIPEGPRRRVRR